MPRLTAYLQKNSFWRILAYITSFICFYRLFPGIYEHTIGNGEARSILAIKTSSTHFVTFSGKIAAFTLHIRSVGPEMVVGATVWAFRLARFLDWQEYFRV
jgi:hypothetical protein